MRTASMADNQDAAVALRGDGWQRKSGAHTTAVAWDSPSPQSAPLPSCRCSQVVDVTQDACGARQGAAIAPRSKRACSRRGSRMLHAPG